VFTHRTGVVVAATGYRERPADFLADVAPLLHRDTAGRLVVGADHAVATDDTVTGRVFVANADLHSHGVAAPDLGIGAVRNATILNTVTGRTVYPLPVNTAFTTFGLAGP
jgi:lysine N6-hydroxylase